MRLTYDYLGSGRVTGIATFLDFGQSYEVEFLDSTSLPSLDRIRRSIAAGTGRYTVSGPAGSRSLNDRGVSLASETVEGAVPISGVTGLQTALDNEATTRAAADTTLTTNVATNTTAIATKQDLIPSGTYVGNASPTPPPSPVVGQEWVSSALRDLRVSASVHDRRVVFSPGTGEGVVNQEPSVWTDATNFNMLYQGGAGLSYRTCPVTADPTIAANWTRYGSACVIGGGAGGVAGQANHASVYVEGATVYCYANVAADNTTKVFTAPKSAPTTWTLVGIVISLPAISGATAFGNSRVVKDDDGTYVMLIEYQTSGRWQVAQATCATPTGTFALVAGTNPSITLYPDAGHQQGGAGYLAKENGEWVMWYHTSESWLANLPSEVWRATAPSLRADNWTLTDADPLIRRVAKYEVDQVADIEVCRAPDGTVYAFWSGCDNRATMAARIYGSVLLPTRKRWTGAAWVAVEGSNDTSIGVMAPRRPALVVLPADYAVFNSAGPTVWTAITGLAVTWTPTGTDFEVEFRAVMNLEGLTSDLWYFRVQTQGLINWGMCAVAGNGTGGRMTVVGVARVTHQVPGLAMPVSIQYKGPSAAIRCRPISVPGVEQATMKITEIDYPIPAA